MRVVCLPDVDQGQHHENEGLQRDDQDVEDGPNRASDDVSNGQQDAAQTHGGGTAHQGDQHEDELARVHVAKESHAVGHGFGDKLNHLETKIDGPENGVGTKRRCGEFVEPAANAFDFDVVEKANQQHRARHAQGGGQVGCRHNAEIMDAAVKTRHDK